jgi:microcin C transport system permease protein
MAAYILRRILLMIPTLFGVMLVTFVVTQFVPGGPVERLLAEIEGHSTAGLSSGKGEVRTMPKSSLYQGAQGLDNEKLEKLQALYGFDKPPVERFLTMMKNFMVFDFGTSYYHHKSVANLYPAWHL